MKTNVVYEEIGTFMCWYGTSPDLPIVIEIFYVFPLVPLRSTREKT